MEVASNIKAIEEELAAMQAELDAVNAQMESATDDERLMLIVEQGDKSDKIEEIKAKLEQENIDGTKRKMEAQSAYDAKLEDARHNLDEANATFARRARPMTNSSIMPILSTLSCRAAVLSAKTKRRSSPKPQKATRTFQERNRTSSTRRGNGANGSGASSR